MTALLVAAGAAIGAPLRYLVGRWLDGALPWGTVAVNLAGSFVLGATSALATAGALAAFVGLGFCGALTTYSAFAVQAVERGPRLGLATVALTVPGALAACALGFALAS